MDSKFIEKLREQLEKKIEKNDKIAKEEMYDKRERCEKCESILKNFKELEKERGVVYAEDIDEEHYYTSLEDVYYETSEGWFDMAAYSMCHTCHNMILVHQYLDEDEDEELCIRIEEADKQEVLKYEKELLYQNLLIKKIGSELNEILSSIEKETDVYVYGYMHYDKIKRNKKIPIYSFIEENAKKGESMNEEEMGLVRLLIDEEKIMLNGFDYETGMSGYLDSSHFFVEEENVKKIQFLDLKNGIWKEESLVKKIKKDNLNFLEKKEKEEYKYREKEKNRLIEIIIDILIKSGEIR